VVVGAAGDLAVAAEIEMHGVACRPTTALSRRSDRRPSLLRRPDTNHKCCSPDFYFIDGNSFAHLARPIFRLKLFAADNQGDRA
jgi:hypothetical protein